RADELQIQHVAQLDVVNELAAPAQETVIFLPRQCFADPAPAIRSRAQVASLFDAANIASTQRRLQTINQLLHILLSERLQQTACHGSQASENLRLALPGNFR